MRAGPIALDRAVIYVALMRRWMRCNWCGYLGEWSVLLCALAAGACSSTSMTPEPAPSHPALSVTSTALKDGQPIPSAYACTDYDHLGKSPPLTWASGPEGVVDHAVTMTDPDAKNFVHWAVTGIPAGITSLAEGASPDALPAGATELNNDFGKPGYGGPCPPKGPPHHYVIRVYALKKPVMASKADVSFFQELDASALAVGSITVTFQR
jgi:Raf kinase inhibitor-like YbhB/YbcL family protein